MSGDQLTFMPPVGDTETLYSICSALNHLRGGSSWMQTGLYFFNDEKASWHRQMPGNLDYFCHVTRNLLGSPEAILEERTVVGFHARFMDPKAAKELVARSRHPRIKFQKSSDPDSKKLRLCAQCVAEDRTLLGRGTWRLEHHLPGARVCMHHGCDLREIVQHNSQAFRYWLRPDDFVEKNPRFWAVDYTRERLSWTALAQIIWILKSHHRVSVPLLHHVLAQKLADIRAIPAARFLSSKAVESWLKKTHEPYLNSGLEPLKGQWLKFLDGKGAQHPLRWAALFAACMGPSEFNRLLGKAYPLQATLDGRWEIPGHSYEDLLAKHVWDALIEGMAVNDVAKHWRLQSRSINRALRLNPELKAIREAKIENNLLLPKREWVCNLLRHKPNASRADLREEDYASLRWLDLNDREWLWRHVPPRKLGRWPQQELFTHD